MRGVCWDGEGGGDCVVFIDALLKWPFAKGPD